MASSFRSSKSEIQKCMKNSKCVRNVSILAHVDHGKTTVADILLATNRLVSKRLAGSLRYLDDRRDEQERKITMKSSAVSLLNIVHDDDTNSDHMLLLNLIDTPGHIDFSSEVTAAVRVCDGALILVDVVEGVCVQTRESIKQAFEQKTKMILVLNKLDRFFTFLMKDIEDVFRGILQVIENCNAIIAELFQYTDSDLDIEDTNLLFQPDKGNVIFASATDGWGFTTKQIAKMFTSLIPNESVDSLDEKIWNFDCYVDSKTKSIKTGAIEHKKMNLFSQLCLKTLEYVYNTIVMRMEKEKVDSILKKLCITNVTRDMMHNDTKIQIKAILEAWKPLADTILQQCSKIVDPPSELQVEKIQYLLNQNYFSEDQYMNECIQNLMPHFKSSSSDDQTPVILYVSKMFCVNKKHLSQNKPKVFVPKLRNEIDKENLQKNIEIIGNTKNTADNEFIEKEMESDVVTVAFARVFTGNLREGQVLYVLLPGYTPNKDKITQNLDEFIENNKNIKKVKIAEVYMLLGRELVLVENIPAGNICAIGGLESSIIRTATLSSTLECVPFIEGQPLEPVVRNVIEPVNPTELPILRQGLKQLMQSDSCVQVITQENGELVLLTSGDVHLEKCLEDLTTKFAKIEISVSSPMVSLRETIIPSSKKYDFIEDDSNKITVVSGPFEVSLIAVSLPHYISTVVMHNYDLLRMIEEHTKKFDHNNTKIVEKTFKNHHTNAAIVKLKEQLKKAFSSKKNFWINLCDKIWSVGKMNNSINLLFNGTVDYECNLFNESSNNDIRSTYNFCITNAFNYSCKSGPLCEEPLMNCAFIIKKFEIDSSLIEEFKGNRLNALTTANIQLQLRSTFREAILKRTLRLLEPIFTTDIQVNTSILGKVYSVINRRHGKVVEAVGMDDQEKTFLVKAQLPVVESVGFANEIRKTTSGQAMPNLKFSHYEMIDGDPFYEPASDDEDEEGVDVENAVRANKLRKEIRRRKGLYVDDQIVVHAEKQRTLNKKK